MFPIPNLSITIFDLQHLIYTKLQHSHMNVPPQTTNFLSLTVNPLTSARNTLTSRQNQITLTRLQIEHTRINMNTQFNRVAVRYAMYARNILQYSILLNRKYRVKYPINHQSLVDPNKFTNLLFFSRQLNSKT